MILLTVGTQLPFDRLVEAMDQYASNTFIEIIAQIGHGNYIPRNFKYECFFSSEQMRQFYEKASLIVSHAGMGTIISALTNKKPILVLPREAAFKEHRNDHQLATAKSFTEKGYIQAAFSTEELHRLLKKGVTPYTGDIGEFASPALLDFIKGFING